MRTLEMLTDESLGQQITSDHRKHEIHHRGQMTVLMCQAGLRVPDLYGPTKEQWAGYIASSSNIE